MGRNQDREPEVDLDIRASSAQISSAFHSSMASCMSPHCGRSSPPGSLYPLAVQRLPRWSSLQELQFQQLALPGTRAHLLPLPKHAPQHQVPHAMPSASQLPTFLLVSEVCGEEASTSSCSSGTRAIR